MDDTLHDTIGGTVDALLRPRTPLPPSRVLRVAVCGDEDGALALAARDAGLVVAYAPAPGVPVGDISDQSRIPPFDLLTANLPDGAQEDVFAFALRFLRVRRPVAFVLAGQGGIEAEFLESVQERTRRLGYRVDGRGTFAVGALWPLALVWPSSLTAQAVIELVARETLNRARD